MKRWLALAGFLLVCACTGRPGTPVVNEVALAPVDEGSPLLQKLARALMELGPESGITVDDLPPSRADAPSHLFHVRAADVQTLSAALAGTGLEAEPGHDFAYECDGRGLEPGPRKCALLYLDMDASLQIREGAFARVGRDAQGSAFVMLTLRKQDGEAFEALTRKYVGHRLAMILDDEVMSSPVIVEPIPGHSVRITSGIQDPGYAESVLARLTEPAASPAAGG